MTAFGEARELERELEMGKPLHSGSLLSHCGTFEAGKAGKISRGHEVNQYQLAPRFENSRALFLLEHNFLPTFVPFVLKQEGNSPMDEHATTAIFSDATLEHSLNSSIALGWSLTLRHVSFLYF